MFLKGKSFIYIVILYILAIIMLVIFLSNLDIQTYYIQTNKTLIKAVNILKPIIGYDFNLYATGPNSYSKRELLDKAKLVNAVVKEMDLMSAGSAKLINGEQYLTMAFVPSENLAKGLLYSKIYFGNVYWNNFSKANKKIYKIRQNSQLLKIIFKTGFRHSLVRFKTSKLAGAIYSYVGILPNRVKYVIAAGKSLKKMNRYKYYIYIKNIILGLVLLILSIFIFFYVQKITEEKEKKRFEKTQIYLEKEIEKKTKELKNANENLFKAIKEKDDFLSNVSHEFKTPLQAILGFSNIIQKKMYIKREHNSEINQLNNEIKKAAIFMNDLTNNIFSKIQNENKKTELKIFSPYETYNSLISIYCLLAKEKNVNFEFKYLTKLPLYIKLDKNKFFQILNNIIQNAFKYTMKNGIIIISISYVDNNLVFNSLDSGKGIKKENLSKIFENNFQEDRTYGGVGIGLKLVKTYVAEMQGIVKVNSEYRNGTEVIVKIPIKEIEYNKNINDYSEWKKRVVNENIAEIYDLLRMFLKELAQKVTYIKKDIKKQQQIKIYEIQKLCHFIDGISVKLYLFEILNISNKLKKIKVKDVKQCIILLENIESNITGLANYEEVKITFKNKILLVDDTQTNIKYYSFLLKSLKLHFDIANNGQEAYNLILKNKYSVVLSDILMPKGTGIDLLKKIKANKLNVKIIALTADSNEKKYIEIGFDAVLLKPTTKDKLVKILMKFSEGKNG